MTKTFKPITKDLRKNISNLSDSESSDDEMKNIKWDQDSEKSQSDDSDLDLEKLQEMKINSGPEGATTDAIKMFKTSNRPETGVKQDSSLKERPISLFRDNNIPPEPNIKLKRKLEISDDEHDSDEVGVKKLIINHNLKDPNLTSPKSR
jgi:hypothetical protein